MQLNKETAAKLEAKGISPKEVEKRTLAAQKKIAKRKVSVLKDEAKMKIMAKKNPELFNARMKNQVNEKVWDKAVDKRRTEAQENTVLLMMEAGNLTREEAEKQIKHARHRKRVKSESVKKKPKRNKKSKTHGKRK